MDLYLITGFLGAGKTTFLKQFVYQFSGRRIWLIINEFGKVGVDGALLQEVNAVMAEITNGSIFCTCRLDRFEDELRRAVADGPDVILVEASGLADPTNVQQVLSEKDFEKIQYRGSVCLVDTPRLEKVLYTARVCPKQIGISSLILLNKSDLANENQMQQASEMIWQVNPSAVLRKTQFGAFQPEWLSDIHPIGAEYEPDNPDIRLQKQLIRVDSALTKEQLLRILRMLSEDTWRIKGIVDIAGKRLLVDCVGPEVRVGETELTTVNENRLVLLAGPGMALRQAVKQVVKWYPDMVWEEKM